MTEASIPADRDGGRAVGGVLAVARFAALILIAGIVLVPLAATVLGGFKELGELHSNPLGLPHVWVWRNYWDILSSWRDRKSVV